MLKTSCREVVKWNPICFGVCLLYLICICVGFRHDYITFICKKKKTKPPDYDIYELQLTPDNSNPR